MLTIEERYKINSTLTGIEFKLQDIDGAMETIERENQHPGIACFIKSNLKQIIKKVEELKTFIKEIDKEKK